METGPELPTELMELLGSVLQQPDSGTVAKQQKERAMERHNGTQKPTLHKKKKTCCNEMKESLHSRRLFSVEPPQIEAEGLPVGFSLHV